MLLDCWFLLNWNIYGMVKRTKGKVIDRFYVKGKKLTHLLSGEVQTLFWLLLWPLVISKILWKFHFSASKWKTADSRRSTTIPSNKQKTSSFQNTLFFLLWHVTWPTSIHGKQWIQYSTKDENRKMCHDRWMEESCFKKSIFFVICWTVWEVSNSLSFSLHRHWRVLFWPSLWPLLCQLCWQFPVPLSQRLRPLWPRTLWR